MTSSQRHTLGSQVTSEHYELTKEAAQRAGLTVAEYVRRIVLSRAASDLGRDSIDLTCYTPDLVAQAAKRMGLSPREFASQAAREAAASVMGLQARTSVIPPPTTIADGSGTRLAAGAGKGRGR